MDTRIRFREVIPFTINSKESYIQGIRLLLITKSKKFAKNTTQLNDKILQKDSEFYSPIRLKQIVRTGESQIDALERRGVKYAEVRILDINPFYKTGISLEQMRFLQVFMLFCLFNENRSMGSKELNRVNKNHHLVALSGRRPNLMLKRLSRGQLSLHDWGEDIFNKLHLLAKLLDHEDNGNEYISSIQWENQKLKDISLLPSAIIQTEMGMREESFLEFGMRIAREYKNDYVKEELKW